MDLLKAEIAKKRQKLETLEVLEPGKTFFRRGKLVAKECELHKKKQRTDNTADVHESADKVESDEKSPVEQRTEIDEPENGSSCVQLSANQMREVMRRLRERKAPVRLFGETDADVFKRLLRLESEAADMEQGFKNEFKVALDKVDQDYLNEAIEGMRKEGTHDVHVEDCSTSYVEIAEMATKLEKGDYDHGCEFVLSLFSFLLRMWALELNDRSEEVKRSAKGRRASAIHKQTREYVEPLFNQLKSKCISGDILEHLVNIASCLLQKDYIQANNHYMQMAIGNAPWPVGVTASGIHKRPGSEKLYVRNVAHVLNDEVQRKYIQALKRLMSRCQSLYPTDPSNLFTALGCSFKDVNFSVASKTILRSGWPVNIACVHDEHMVQPKDFCWWWKTSNGEKIFLNNITDAAVWINDDVLTLAAPGSYMTNDTLFCADSEGRLIHAHEIEVVECNDNTAAVGLQRSACSQKGHCTLLHTEGIAPLVNCQCDSMYGEFCHIDLRTVNFYLICYMV
ncbi:pre-mRNA-splicing factor 18 family protein [Trichuris suis]|nr:pre-mRNA-splicing factor 18 family protein [Trichuris suis]